MSELFPAGVGGTAAVVRPRTRKSAPAPAPQKRSHGKCFACELLFAEVAPKQRAEFDAMIHDHDFGHNKVIHRDMAPADAVYFIQKGAVKLLKPGFGGKQRIVRVLKPGDVIGIESIFSDAYEHSAITLGDVTACSVPADWFRDFAAGSGRTQMWLLQKSLAALKEVETWLSQFSAGSIPVDVRMARLMLHLRAEDGYHIHRLSLKEMGDIVGLVPESVCRVISEFDRKGVVVRDAGGSVFSRRYYRGNIPALEKIAQE
ncbi:MAG: Crp/Fnr family transcriptional regulator [Sterolibacterium sp.]